MAAEQPNPPPSKASETIEQLVAAGKLLLIAALFVFVAFNWSFFSEWLRSVQHAELPFGLKFDRASAEIDNLFKATNPLPRTGDPDIARAAVRHAELLGGAIQGAKILWVDPVPNNNLYERGILENMGVSVQLAWSTTEALRILAVSDEDLVISNMFRTNDETTTLSKCPAVYYTFPDQSLSDKYKGDIWQFNADEQKKPTSGFAMAELMADKFPDPFSDHQRPRIIFYTAGSGGISSSECARIVTNRPDVLLDNVVGALATLRWQHLPAPPTPSALAAKP
jgi:hypothetical protein